MPSRSLRSAWVGSLFVLLAAAPVLAQPSNSIVDRARRLVGSLRTPSSNERLYRGVRAAFKEVVKKPIASTVRVLSGAQPVALGTVVGADGYVLTKFSELNGNLSCRLADSRSYDATIVGVDKSHDLALLKLPVKKLTAINWANPDQPPKLGSWVATCGLRDLPVSVGVISAASRPIRRERGFLGVGLREHPSGVQITQVLPGGVAEKGGVRPRDVVIAIDGEEIESLPRMQEIIGKRRPETAVEMHVLRGKEKLQLRILLGRQSDAIPHLKRMAFQMKLGGEISSRRDDFPRVLEHDSVLSPHQCGGPLVDLEGKAVGVNIARESRVSSFAIPASVVIPLIKELRAGKGKELLAEQTRLEKRIDDLRTDIRLQGRRLSKQRETVAAVKRQLKSLTTTVEKNSDDKQLKSRLERVKEEAEREAKRESALKAAFDKAKKSLEKARKDLISLRN